MANTISAACSLSNGNSIAPINVSQAFSFVQAGSYSIETLFTVTSGGTVALPLGSIGTVGAFLVRNLDATNFVEIGINTPLTQKFTKLLPGQSAMWVAEPGVTYYALANTANCQVLVVAIEN